MTHTGIFGGTFNPIHNGHIALAKAILKLTTLDEIWFVVSPQNPWKQHHTLLPDEQRLAMVRAALNGEPHLHACDIEFHLPRPSYMWHTLQTLSDNHPDRQFTLVIGGDNWQGFTQWYHYQDILTHYPIIVYPRTTDNKNSGDITSGDNGNNSDDTTPSNIATAQKVSILSTPLLDISSTDIRQRIQQRQPYQHLLPTAVAEIIEEGKLYQ